MKSSPLVLAVLFICALECSGQQSTLSDEQAMKAATKAFTEGGWNPQIFESQPITLRFVTADKVLSDPALQKDLLKEFGRGPCTSVSYIRRPETLKANGGTNGGESYCRIFFLIFSPSKVAIIDSRAYPCPEDKLPKKTP